MGVFSPSTGLPGVSAERVAKHRVVTADGYLQFAPGGVILDGLKTRDPDNPDWNATTFADATQRLRAGLLVGRQTQASTGGIYSSTNNAGKYANSVIGVLQGALGGSATTLTLSIAQATELVRRIGTSGNITISGPPTPGGVTRQIQTAFSAVNTATGVVTITATAIASGGGTNAVYPLDFVDSSGSGTFTLTIEGITTGAITYSSTAATLFANINTALNAVFGASAIVASGASLAAIILTFSGTGYTHRPINGVSFDILTGSTGYTINGVGTLNTPTNVVATTAGVLPVTADEGEFIAGSFVGDTDGSQTPMTFLPDGWEMLITSINGTTVDLPLAQPPIEGNLIGPYLLPWPSDTGLQAWIRSSLNTAGRFTFTELFTGTTGL